MLSVIVPALNEESCLKACLEAILRGGADEIVVVDGGSDDGSTNVARRYERVRTIGAPRGRALQMNAGAAASSGEFLLFCHADTVLPDGYADAVRQTLADNRVTLGAFRFRLAENRAAYRAIEFGVALRCALLGMPYGDQAFFCRRADFDRVGGFAPPPALEDICFVRAIKRFGTVRILPLPALTSDRAWRENGALRQTLRNYARALRHALAAAPPAEGPVAEPIVIVFTKAPEPGRVKTRLAKELGDDAAAALYRKVGGEVFARLKSLSGVRLVVAAAPEGDLTLLTSWLGPDIELWIQSGRGLGERMAHAARDAFEEGASKVIIVGCDGPELSAETVTDALAALEAADAVFVPTRDGGYILVGLARYVPNLFTGMAYGHDAVLRDTTARAEQLGLRVAKLPEQKDLDEPEDLRLFPELAHWVEQGAFGHGKERSES